MFWMIQKWLFSEYEDGDDEFDDWTVQPTSVPENVIGDNLYQWVFNDIYESDTESVATNDSKACIHYLYFKAIVSIVLPPSVSILIPT